MGSRPRLVYAGHSFHQMTASSRFLIDMLEREYDVSVVWDDSWKPSGTPLRAAQINALNPDLVLFYQTLTTPKELRRLKCKRLVIVPMHDYVVSHPLEMWIAVRDSGMRALNFCRATHEIFVGLGYESRCVQYWPEVQANDVDPSDQLQIFFWPRIKQIGWPLLKTLLGDMRPQRVVIRVAADPGHEIDMPNSADIGQYNIEVIDGWLEKSRYVQLLTSCNMFFAPRHFEGIGQSFLEAMAYGLAVVAPRAPTMSEYISDGQNGYLYDLATPSALDLRGFGNVRQRALADVREGHRRWRAEQTEIAEYLRAPSRVAAKFWRLRALLRV